MQIINYIKGRILGRTKDNYISIYFLLGKYLSMFISISVRQSFITVYYKVRCFSEIITLA